MCLAWKFFTRETAFESFLLSAFPVYTSFLAFSALPQHSISPITSKASVFLVLEDFTVTTKNTTSTNLIVHKLCFFTHSLTSSHSCKTLHSREFSFMTFFFLVWRAGTRAVVLFFRVVVCGIWIPRSIFLG